jgi:hypothetical protein
MPDTNAAVSEATEADEDLHPPTTDPNFNESMAFMFHEQKPGGAAGILRVGNRVNEGWAEMTVLVLLPDGRAAIRFERPEVQESSWQHLGLSFEVLEPLRRARATYAGPARLLPSSLDLANPKAALSSSPEVDLRIDLEYGAAGPLFRLGEGDPFLDAIATDHYQGVCTIAGTMTLDGFVNSIAAVGWRDHSWGPRNWQGVRYWRWVSCFVDSDNYFAGWLHGVGDAPCSPGMGVVRRRGRTSPLVRMELTSGYSAAPEHYPVANALKMTTAKGEVFGARGTAYHTVPLRHRRDGVTTRITEIVCRQEFDGLVGYGFSEYLDTIIGGVPAGLDEA